MSTQEQNTPRIDDEEVTSDPAIAAQRLFMIGTKSSEYKNLQYERLRRLDFFKTKGIEVLIRYSLRLYEFGEQVMAHLESLEKNEATYGKQNMSHIHRIAELLTALEQIRDFKVDADYFFDNICDMRNIAKSAIQNYSGSESKHP